jgi:tetratricopeptide (TPR) repeat protein
MQKLRDGQVRPALDAAQKWQRSSPGDVLALIALGEALEALGDRREAARAYGAIIDLFPGRADLRRFAGQRLDRLGGDCLWLAVDTYQKARAQRPDHPSSHRLLAFALLRAGNPAEAFAVIAEGARRSYPADRFPGVPRILNEDTGLIAAAWIKQAPADRAAIAARAQAERATVPTAPSLRFVLNWETDANDVDFHIHDGHGGHAYYGSRNLPSGGTLYADITTGYGPECFTIEGEPHAYPYQLQAHYYSRGPMGYGMGKLEILEHDGQGGLCFDERPFVIMQDRAFIDLGEVKGRLAPPPPPK